MANPHDEGLASHAARLFFLGCCLAAQPYSRFPFLAPRKALNLLRGRRLSLELRHQRHLALFLGLLPPVADQLQDQLADNQHLHRLEPAKQSRATGLPRAGAGCQIRTGLMSLEGSGTTPIPSPPLRKKLARAGNRSNADWHVNAQPHRVMEAPGDRPHSAASAFRWRLRYRRRGEPAKLKQTAAAGA